MGNILSILQEIFMLKENNSVQIGLSCYKQENSNPSERPQKKATTPKELKLSDLMRKSSC